MKITEGYMDFRGYQTYYRIVGEKSAEKAPLLLLHGGPGSTHNTLEMLDPVAEDGRQVIMYDQIGCGRSQAPGRTDLFRREVWVEELIRLREHLGIEQFHLFGQSWGGMLLLEYVCGVKPEGLKSIILASTLPSSALWVREQRRMLLEMPQEMQDAVAEADRTGNYDAPDVKAADREFMLRHCGPHWSEVEGAAECLTRKRPDSSEAYVTGWGPNEFTCSGNLKDFDRIADLPDIKVPALVTSGIRDECTPLIAKLMYDSIPDSRWELFAESRHQAYAEENEKYLRILKGWLNEHD